MATVRDLIYNKFREGNTLWFDYVDSVKTKLDIQRKGLKYERNGGCFEMWIVSEEGDEILIDILRDEDTDKFENILKVFWQ